MSQYSKIIHGTFTSTGVAKFLSLPMVPDMIETWNLSKWGTTTNHTGVAAVGFATSAAGTAYGTQSNGTTWLGKVIASGGFTFVNASTPTYGPTLTITGITQAADASVTTSGNHNLAVGDAVLIYGTTAMLQISGVVYTVKAVSSATVFTIEVDSSAFAAAATAGFCKKVLYPDLYLPQGVGIIGVTAANPGVVTTAQNHNFVVGQEVFFQFPQTGTGLNTFGMYQLDSAAYLATNGVPQKALVTAVTSNTFTINIDTSGYQAFLYPTSSQYATGITPPMVFAIGDQNTGYSLNSSGNVPFVGVTNGVIGIPGSFAANTRQGVIVGVGDGTEIIHATTDVIRWRATFPDSLLLNQ